MQNIFINMCEKFHYNRLRNDRALGNGKSDNNCRQMVSGAFWAEKSTSGNNN